MVVGPAMRPQITLNSKETKTHIELFENLANRPHLLKRQSIHCDVPVLKSG